MTESFKDYENLTRNEEMPEKFWRRYVIDSLKKINREDLLNNPTVLDLGGGMGLMSEYLNKNDIKCVSLDVKDTGVKAEANPVKANAYNMPFADESFDIVYSRGAFDDAIYPHYIPTLIKEISRVLKKDGMLFDISHDLKMTNAGTHFSPIILPTHGEERIVMWEKKKSES